MNRILTLAAALFALSVNVSAQDTVKKTFDFGEFEGVKAGFIHHIYVTEGKSDEIEVTCPERFAEDLNYNVVNGILNLDIAQPKIKSFLNVKGGNIIVRIQMDRIESIALSGAAVLTPEGSFKAEDAVIKLSGTGKVNGPLNLKANSLDFDLSGASECSLTGSFSEVSGEVSGASQLRMDADAGRLEIDASGATKCKYAGKAETIGIESSGAAEVRLKGSTEDIIIECSGAAKVDAQEMISDNAKATADGASTIKVYANKRLELQSGGASSIKYFGEAKDLHISDKSISKGK